MRFERIDSTQRLRFNPPQANEVHICNFAGGGFSSGLIERTVALAKSVHAAIRKDNGTDLLNPEDVRNKCSTATEHICLAARRDLKGLLDGALTVRGIDVPGLSNGEGQDSYHDIALLRSGPVSLTVDVTAAQIASLKKPSQKDKKLLYNSTQVLLVTARSDEIFHWLNWVYKGGRWGPIGA